MAESTTSQFPDLTPVPNVEEGDSDYLTDAGEKGEDKESVASEVMLSSEASEDPTTIEREKKENEPVSELSKGATREVEESPKGEALMSVEDQGIVSATLSGEDGADKTAVSSDKRGGNVRDGDPVSVVTEKKPGVPLADCEELRTKAGKTDSPAC